MCKKCDEKWDGYNDYKKLLDTLVSKDKRTK